MEKKDIIIYAAVLVFVAFRLYKKYAKKDQSAGGNSVSVKKSDDSSLSGVKDEEYEPYSKK